MIRDVDLATIKLAREVGSARAVASLIPRAPCLCGTEAPDPPHVASRRDVLTRLRAAMEDA